MSAASPDRVVELERDILRALCCGPRREETMEALKRYLSGYVWRYQEHRVVFEALQGARGGESGALRKQLPTHATRMGFPDVDWDVYFDLSSPPRDIEKLVRDLKELATPE